MHTHRTNGKTAVAVLFMAMLLAAFAVFDRVQSMRSTYHDAALIELHPSDAPVTLPSGVSVLLEEDAVVSAVNESGSILRLKKGSILLASTSHSTVVAHAARVDLLGASAYLHTDDTHLTVAALHAPVLVTASSAAWIIPEGFQINLTAPFTHGSIAPVPSFWLSQKRARLVVPPADFSLQSLAQVHQQIASGSGTPLASLLALRLVQDVQEDDVSAFLTDVLARDSVIADLEMSILRTALSARRPLPAPLLTFLEKRLTTRIIAHPANLLFIAPVLTEIRTWFIEQGFPRSAETWQSVQERLTTLGMPLLSRDEQNQLRIMKGPVHPRASQTGVTVINAVPMHPADAERLARSALMNAGILFMVDTSFSPVAEQPGKIHVTNLFYSGSHDHTFDLIYDTATTSVSRIVLDGQRLPNALPLQEFIASL